MTEVVAHDGQFGTVRESMGRMGMAHPVRTGLLQFLCNRRAISFDEVCGSGKEPLQHVPEPRAGDGYRTVPGETRDQRRVGAPAAGRHG
ncbi:hypothetical protein R69776_08232 [Paraburkholderia nemoris]|uniref:Transcriptional regulator n=1 Tax=Paraburkholderia nemoris TaxID=2793076 RepID=A0ABM8T8J8_9BURK|nr:hypothetical protein R69776_08232 [Paraburkholderia nemoris]